jgi:outer membrane protein
MRRCWTLSISLLLATPLPVLAQDSTTSPAPAATLSLAEALQQATAHNPVYQQTLNNAGTARWASRNAWGSLLPGFSLGGGVDYSGSGQANFGQGFTRATSATIRSSYNATLNWNIDGGRLVAPSQQRANSRATEEEIAAEANNLKFNVTNQYLTVAAATAQVAVARQQVQRNQTFLDLANAKYRVGQGTLIEVRQAEVQKATSDVDLLRQLQAESEAKIELFRLMGVLPPAPVELIALTDSFPVVEPTVQLDQLIDMAADQNPSLRALKSRRDAATIGVRAAKSAFLPSLTMQAGWSGFAQQQTDKNLLLSQSLAGAQGGASECFTNDSIRVGAGLGSAAPAGGCYIGNGLNATGTALDPAVSKSIVNGNNVFPFHFTSQPFGASLFISLPIFTGFGRSLRLAQAREQEQDADEQVRANGLQVQADVHSRYLALQTAYKAIAVQGQSRDAARDQLRLAQDRYRLGSGSSLEVTDAQNAVQRAEGDYINAVYAYHRALAALEAAVGRPLR